MNLTVDGCGLLHGNTSYVVCGFVKDQCSKLTLEHLACDDNLYVVCSKPSQIHRYE